MNQYWLLEMLPENIRNLKGMARVDAVRSYLVDLGIKFKEPYHHDKTRALGHLAVLAYDQLASTHHLLLNRLSRGITVDVRDFSVVSRPFERFFNYGERDISEFLKLAQREDCRIEVVEKVDGSLMRLFYEPSVGKWLLHTRLSYAESPLPMNEYMSYSMAFVHALKGEYAEIDRDSLIDMAAPFYQGDIGGAYEAHVFLNRWAEEEKLDKGFTYLFELCTPFNEAVVKQKGISLYFLGKSLNHPDKDVLLNRQDWVLGENQKQWAKHSMQNHRLSIAAGLALQNQSFVNPNIRYPLRAQMGTAEAMAIIALNDSKSGYEHEGHILYIDGIPSVKIKSASYINLHHHVSNELTFKNAVDAVRMGEYEEMLAYHPEAKPMLDKIQNLMLERMGETQEMFDGICQKYGIDPHLDILPVNQMQSPDRKKLFSEEIPQIPDKLLSKWLAMRLTKAASVAECVGRTAENEFYRYMADYFRESGAEEPVDKHRNKEHKSPESLAKMQAKLNRQRDVIARICKDFPVKKWQKQDFYNLAQMLQDEPEYRPIFLAISHYLRHSIKQPVFAALQRYLEREDNGESLKNLLGIESLKTLNGCLVFL